jgi:hypothetical protein
MLLALQGEHSGCNVDACSSVLKMRSDECLMVSTILTLFGSQDLGASSILYIDETGDATR